MVCTTKTLLEDQIGCYLNILRPFLREAIASYGAKLPQMGQLWPRNWQKVEKDLKEIDEPHITYPAFIELCHKYELTEQVDIETLAETLHNLGIILHFNDDPSLDNLIVLKPNWITKAISLALTDEGTRKRYGCLHHAELPRIWKEYDKSLYPAFFRLMNKFELSYQIEDADDQSLIPALLPFKPPETPSFEPRLQMIYHLSSVPAGLISRFTVRTHRFTKNMHWRDGVYLEYDGQQARAELSEYQRELRLIVGGSSPTNFFAVLVDTLNQILGNYPGLEIRRLVPCTCQGEPSEPGWCEHLFHYEDLVRRYEHQIQEAECESSYKKVNVTKLLYGIHESSHPQILQDVAELLQKGNVTTEPDRQVILLGQRSVIQTFNSLESVDTQCPNIFTLSKFPSERLGLNLVCQSSEGWHSVSDEAYRLPVDRGVNSILAPLMAESLPLLKHLIPVSGSRVNLHTESTEEKQKLLVENLRLMQNIVNNEPTNKGRVEAIRESLEKLHDLLEKLDPEQEYRGLRSAISPDGHRLWLCPFHYAQLQPRPLDLENFPYDAFLCHNSRDKAIVRLIGERLERSNIKCWLDEKQILGGDHWQDAMARGLREAASTVICIGEHEWGNWQWEEIQVALDQAVSKKKHRVIPLLIPPRTKLPRDFPAFLRIRHAITLSSLEDEEGIESLMQSIRAGSPSS